MTELSVFIPPSTREQLARGQFFEGIENYRKNEDEGYENK